MLCWSSDDRDWVALAAFAAVTPNVVFCLRLTLCQRPTGILRAVTANFYIRFKVNLWQGSS
jgi:hypothetical protein